MMKSGKMEGEGQDGEATWQGRGRMGERHAGICLEPCTSAFPGAQRGIVTALGFRV